MRFCFTAGKAVAVLAVLLLAASCESVKTASLLSLSGAADSAELRAQALDVRTGSSYEGELQRVTQGSGPIAPGPIPAAAFGDAVGSHVISVWTPIKLKP